MLRKKYNNFIGIYALLLYIPHSTYKLQEDFQVLLMYEFFLKKVFNRNINLTIFFKANIVHKVINKTPNNGCQFRKVSVNVIIGPTSILQPSPAIQVYLS